MGSARRTTIAVRTVFRCVASRNRERTARPRGAARHSKTGFDSDKRNARGYSWSSTFTGSDARYLGFNYGFLARQASKTPGGRGFPLRCLQEEGGGRAADFTLEPGGAQPSRGESISFLSPARAAGAPTFCDATESRQRTQPRGLSPPWPSPAATRTWPKQL